MTNPIVSVIVPCYNQGKYLADAVRSLLNQTFQDLECIIINDGSEDDTREIARELQRSSEKIVYIEQTNQGLSAARNAGIAAARGQFLQFLDADDELEPQKIAAHLSFLSSHPDVDIVYGDARYFTTENRDLRDLGPYAGPEGVPWIPSVWHAPGTVLEKLLQRNTLAVNCALLRAQVFRTIGNWNTSLQALEDWEFWIRCAGAGLCFAFVDDEGTLALIRMHPESMTRDTRRMDRAAYEMRVFTGPSLKKPTDLLVNFKKGERALRHLRPEKFFLPLLSLARANRCAATYANFSITSLKWAFERSAIFRIYRNTVPWPVQKFVRAFFRRSSD